MLLDERFDVVIVSVKQGLEVNQTWVAAIPKRAVLVQDVGDAAAHAGGEIASGGAEHHHAPAGHVFAAVIAHAFDHRVGTAVAHAKPFRRHAAKETLAGSRAVQHHVADENLLLGLERACLRRIDDEASAGETLANVVVGVAFHFQCYALGQPSAETLPRAASELEVDGAVRQHGRALPAHDLVGEDAADNAVSVPDGQRHMHALAARKGRFGERDEPMVQGMCQTVILGVNVVGA